jgi:CheY-like chemotaxis protein
MSEQPIVNPAIDEQLRNPPKILAVDDDGPQLELYDAMLRAWECERFMANNIPKAIELCQRIPITITLLDLRFTGQPLSGIDFLKQVVQMPRRPKVAILTAYIGGPEYREALGVELERENDFVELPRLGHYYVAPKPYTRDALAEILRRNGIILRPAHAT